MMSDKNRMITLGFTYLLVPLWFTTPFGFSQSPAGRNQLVIGLALEAADQLAPKPWPSINGGYPNNPNSWMLQKMESRKWMKIWMIWGYPNLYGHFKLRIMNQWSPSSYSRQRKGCGLRSRVSENGLNRVGTPRFASDCWANPSLVDGCSSSQICYVSVFCRVNHHWIPTSPSSTGYFRGLDPKPI